MSARTITLHEMRQSPIKSSLILFLLCSAAAITLADERIMVEGAKVNGTPVRMAFDTGADDIYFFPSTAKRLHLKTSIVKNLWGQKLGMATEKCTVQFWSSAEKLRVPVIRQPPFTDPDALDGFLGWQAISDKVLVFNTLSNTVQFVPEVPKEAIQWTKIELRWDSFLVLKVADHGGTGRIVIDTGSESGLGLSPERWREWKETHHAQALTCDASYMPGPNLFVPREQTWAPEYTLGPVTLTDVVVETADPVTVRHAAGKHTATLGLAALKRLDLVVDARHDVAYLRPKTTKPKPDRHNHLGAVFVPADAHSDALVGHVVAGSPAYEAGIRDGDVLLKVGEKDVTDWRTSTNRSSSLWIKPAGTRIDLTLQRSNKIFETTVTLRDLLPPNDRH